jgi:tetratricopeptide (TPR) repeat protein
VLENPSLSSNSGNGFGHEGPSLVDRLLNSDKSADFDHELWFQAGVTFGGYGAYDRAVQAFEKIQASYPDRAKLIRNLGLAQLQARRYAAVRPEFRDLVSEITASNETYLLLAEAYDGAGMPEKAYDAYGQALEMDPKSERRVSGTFNFAVAHHITSLLPWKC